MLALNKTRTVDVSMWNYWHFAFCGWNAGLLQHRGVCFGLSAAAIAAIVMVLRALADWSAPLVAKNACFGLEGISLPTCHLSSSFNWLLFIKIYRQDPLPGVNRIHIDRKTFRKNGNLRQAYDGGCCYYSTRSCWASLPGMTLNISCC